MVKTGNCMRVSKLLGGARPSCPPKVYAYAIQHTSL